MSQHSTRQEIYWAAGSLAASFCAAVALTVVLFRVLKVMGLLDDVELALFTALPFAATQYPAIRGFVRRKSLIVNVSLSFLGLLMGAAALAVAMTLLWRLG
jgi:hypothetical protein